MIELKSSKFCFGFYDKGSGDSGWPRTYLAKADLERLVHLPPRLRHRKCRYTPLCLGVYTCLSGKHSQMNYRPGLKALLFYAVLFCFVWDRGFERHLL